MSYGLGNSGSMNAVSVSPFVPAGGDTLQVRRRRWQTRHEDTIHTNAPPRARSRNVLPQRAVFGILAISWECADRQGLMTASSDWNNKVFQSRLIDIIIGA